MSTHEDPRAEYKRKWYQQNSKPPLGQNWTAILKKAGIPDSPGYHETIAKLYPQEKTNDTRSN